MRCLAKCCDLAAPRDHFPRGFFTGLSSSGGSSRTANGVRFSSSRFHSSIRRSLTFSAKAARARIRFGYPRDFQNALRCRLHIFGMPPVCFGIAGEVAHATKNSEGVQQRLSARLLLGPVRAFAERHMSNQIVTGAVFWG